MNDRRQLDFRMPHTSSSRHPSSSSLSDVRRIIAISLTIIAVLVDLNNGRFLDNPNLSILRRNFSSFTAAARHLQSPALTAYLLPLTLVLLTSLALSIAHLKRKVRVSPIPGLPTVPNAHWLLGHYSSLVNVSQHHALFHHYSTPSGISSLWGPSRKVCVTILKAEHVRLLLRHTSSRELSSFVAHHGRKTLGQDSLILMEGGKHWKKVRTAVSKAFSIGAIQRGRGAVGECAVTMVRWLLQASSCDSCSDDGGPRKECGGHFSLEDENGKQRHVVVLDVEDFFKLFSLDVFGRVAMDYDFQSLKKATSTSIATNGTTHNRKICTCITSPPEASAFEWLERDIGVRAHPKHLINPFVQFYWMPTRQNWEYHKNVTLVNGLMGWIIGMKLDDFLLRHQQLQEKQQHRIQQSNGHNGGGDDDEGEDNMITMTLRSVIEQYYQEKDQNQQQHLNSSVTSTSSSCPFTPSSRSSFSSFTTDLVDIPTPMSKSDRTQIVNNATKIIHTLLVAGYETTAVSLTYTMYELSKNPRCQDRACEEARRVLPTLNEHTEFDEDALPYNKAIIMESLRLHLPVMFTTRVSSKDLILDTDDEGGLVTIPKGTRFIINPTLVHRCEMNFERADEFLPERWVKWKKGGWVERDFEQESESSVPAAAETKNTSSPPPSAAMSDKYATENAQADTISAADPRNFFAFSDGARNCLGRRLAMMESTIFVAVLLRDMCLDFAEKDYELVKQRRFVILAPNSLPIAFWKRDD